MQVKIPRTDYTTTTTITKHLFLAISSQLRLPLKLDKPTVFWKLVLGILYMF